MRVLVLVDCYPPVRSSTAKLFRDLAVEMRRQGHAPILVVPDEGLDPPSRECVEEGVTVFRVRTGRIKGARLLRRGWNERRLPSRIWKAGRGFLESHPCDLLVFHSPTIFFGPLVRRLKKIWGCPSYLILRDIFPQWAVDAGVLRKGLLYLYLKRMERIQNDAADVIGVQSPANLDYFKGSGRSVEVLYNWMTPDPPPLPRSDYRREWGLEGKVVFFYGGNLGVAQDMDNVIRLAAALREEPRAAFLVVGEGREAARLKKLAMPNLRVRDAVDQEEFAGMVGQFDVGLISLHRGLRTQNFPGKMLAYMRAGIPILASVNPGNDLQDLLEKDEAGLVAVNGDDARLAGHARRLLEEPLRRRMGLRGRSLLARVFSVEAAVRQVISRGVGPRPKPSP